MLYKNFIELCRNRLPGLSVYEWHGECYAQSDIIFALKNSQSEYNLDFSPNITAKQYNSPKANITEKTPSQKLGVFSWHPQ